MTPGSSVLREKLVPSRAHLFTACDSSSFCEFVKILDVRQACMWSYDGHMIHDQSLMITCTTDLVIVTCTSRDWSCDDHMTYLKVNILFPGEFVDSFVLENSVTMADSFSSKLFNCLTKKESTVLANFHHCVSHIGNTTFSSTPLILTPMGRKKVSILTRCPYFRGVLREGFHCILNWTQQAHRRYSTYLSNIIRRTWLSGVHGEMETISSSCEESLRLYRV